MRSRLEVPPPAPAPGTGASAAPSSADGPPTLLDRSCGSLADRPQQRPVIRDRSHTGPPRGERLRLRLSSEELALVAAAAADAGLSVSGFAADAVVAVVTDGPTPLREPLRSALADLVDVRSQLRHLATNVHLAAQTSHRDGVPPSWARAAVQDASIAVARVDAAATAVAAALPKGRM